jgi:hypothetical protein
MKLTVLLALLSSALFNTKGVLTNDIHSDHDRLQSNMIECCTLKFTDTYANQEVKSNSLWSSIVNFNFIKGGLNQESNYNNLKSMFDNIRIKGYDCDTFFLREKSKNGLKMNLDKLNDNEYALKYCYPNPIVPKTLDIRYYDQDEE